MLTGRKIDSRFLDRWERDVYSGLEPGTGCPSALVHDVQVREHLGHGQLPMSIHQHFPVDRKTVRK